MAAEIEEDSSRLTGGQVQLVLDYFIYQALHPIIRYSDIFDAQLAHLLAYAATNRKRKLSAHERETFMSLVCKALSETDKLKKCELVSQLKIERGFIYKFIVNFLTACKEYQNWYRKFMTATDVVEKTQLDRKMAVIENLTGIQRRHLFSVISFANDHLELAYEFRNKIVRQYIKYAYRYANSHCKDHPNYDKNDVFQNLIAAIARALDKYDSSKGALTSYVQYWIQHALTYRDARHGYEYGIAYTVSAQQKKQQATGASHLNNFSISMDAEGGDDEHSLAERVAGDDGIDMQIERKQELNTLRILAKLADPEGLARLYLDIEEIFSKREKRIMREHMRQQGIKV